MSQARIVIVEDEAIVAADIEECLQSFGYDVCKTASSAASALEAVNSCSPDVVLMDIMLKGDGDGISAAQQIRDRFDIPVIFLTAHADPATLNRAKVTRPYGYVLKPFKEVELRAAIEVALYRSKEHVDHQQNGNAPLDNLLERFQVEHAEGELQRINELLPQIEPFSQLDEDLNQRIARSCRLETLKGGRLLVFQGQEGTRGFVPIRGRLAMVKTSESGKELVVELLPPGDSFGLLAGLFGNPSPISVRTQIESEVLWVPQEVIMLILDSYSDVVRRFLESTFARLRAAHDVSRALAHDSVDVRVASALTLLIPRFSGPAPSGARATCVIDMTRQELADLIGSTPETVIRITKQMERDGILDLSQSGKIGILQEERLEELSAGELRI
ncbi:MAG: response regulator [Bdellovibrionales bacterium]|nr:response regulator [Bdellovibrionales bacterium]